MITIHEKTATSGRNWPINNGLAVLEPIECLFKPAINGVWTLEMTVPYDEDQKYDYIEKERILKVTGIDCIAEYGYNNLTYQLFRIYNYKRQDDSVYVLAYPIALDARFDTYKPQVRLFNKTASEALLDINNLTSKYSISGTGYGSEKRNLAFDDTNIIQILNGNDNEIDEVTYKSFVNTYDGEICYDNYHIQVNHRLGANLAPIDVRYGKNLEGMSYDEDTSNVITRLYPRAKSGELLNAVSAYKISNNHYVDAPNASEYNTYLPHEYCTEAPYVLVQTTNDGSAEYTATMNLYNKVKNGTANWLKEALLSDTSTNGLLTMINLEWITKVYNLTKADDNVEGIVERLCTNICNNNIVASSVKSLIFDAMMAGFDDVLKSGGSRYIGSSSKKWFSDAEPQYYSYNWSSADSEEYRDRPLDGSDYIWVYASSKWKQLDSDGYSTGSEDKTTWKWYKNKSSDTYKHYGNKSKKRYLHGQWWKINDVIYYFESNGHSRKGNTLLTLFMPYISSAKGYNSETQQNETLSQTLTPIITGSQYGEPKLFNLLYTQMTSYCNTLFTTQGLSYPVPKIEINFVDLSQTTEYADFQGLEKIKLGNTVNVTNPKIGKEPKQLRVTGLTYDVLRRCNTEIQIGVTESTIINLLNSIGNNNSGNRIISGTSVPTTSSDGVKDVILDGESCVYGQVAYLDLHLEDIGLQWFEETENALYGINDILQFMNDPRYDYHGESISVYQNNWEIAWTPSRAFDGKLIAFPQATSSYQYKIGCRGSETIDASNGGFMILSKNSADLSFIHRGDLPGTSDPRNWSQNGSISYSSVSTNSSVQMALVNDAGRTAPGYGLFGARTTVEYEGETWYCLCIVATPNGNTPYSSNYPSVSTYIQASEIPNTSQSGYEGYDTIEEALTALMGESIEGDGKYSGLARTGGLAFFAGGEDEFGKDAPIKIFTDGRYIGLDKVEDVQLEGVSLVDENKIAHVDDAVKVSDVKYGNTSLVTDKIAQLDSLQKKLTAGDNVHISNQNVISATDTTYNDFNGSAHGLVPKPTGASSGRYLKEDGTWEVPSGGGGGSSDLDAVELTKAQYDALTPEQKADTDRIYFVEDYNPPSGGGSTVTITPSLVSGTKVADYEIDGIAGELYAPSPMLFDIKVLQVHKGLSPYLSLQGMDDHYFNDEFYMKDIGNNEEYKDYEPLGIVGYSVQGYNDIVMGKNTLLVNNTSQGYKFNAMFSIVYVASSSSGASIGYYELYILACKKN